MCSEPKASLIFTNHKGGFQAIEDSNTYLERVYPFYIKTWALFTVGSLTMALWQRPTNHHPVYSRKVKLGLVNFLTVNHKGGVQAL